MIHFNDNSYAQYTICEQKGGFPLNAGEESERGILASRQEKGILNCSDGMYRYV
jgi:hypothetical protein